MKWQYRIVDSAVKVCDRRLREAGDRLLDVTDSLGSVGWLTRARVVPELQVLDRMSYHLGAYAKS